MHDDSLAPFRDDPIRSAVLLDIDGTLAPTVAHPSDSRVPPATLAILGRLVSRYGLVGCVSGRSISEARALVPVEGLAFCGNHGLELLIDGAVRPVAGVETYRPRLRDAANQLEAVVHGAGGWIEDKGLTLTIHYRQSPDIVAAERLLKMATTRVSAALRLRVHPGRMSFEVRPPAAADKGTGVRELLAGSHIERSLYVGDDTTDIDAFAVVDIAVAVLSLESPPGLVEAATFTVEGTAGVAELLARLAA